MSLMFKHQYSAAVNSEKEEMLFFASASLRTAVASLLRVTGRQNQGNGVLDAFSLVPRLRGGFERQYSASPAKSRGHG